MHVMTDKQNKNMKILQKGFILYHVTFHYTLSLIFSLSYSQLSVCHIVTDVQLFEYLSFQVCLVN